MHYLKRELYDLVKSDDAIFDFLQIGSLDGIWYWDLEHPEHEWMSPELWRLFGVDPEAKGHFASEWQDLIHPDDLALALENFQKHLEDPAHPYDQIVRYRHADGHMVTVRCRGLAIRNEEGEPVRMLGAHNDLTELKTREAELAAAITGLAAEVTRANSAVEARTAFLATMSHEIRTPLNVILGLLDLIKSDETASDKTRERADVGYRAAEMLMTQLVNVLEAARIDSDAAEYTPRAEETAALAVSWREALEGSAIRYGKPMRTWVTAADDLPEQIVIDLPKVTQVVNNLIDNAMKFTSAREADGSVCITLEHDAAAAYPVSITVLDTGPGIEEQDRDRVFQRFTQLDNAVSLHKGGAGLGLSICHELAALMGGRISILDHPPEGFSLGVRLQLPEGDSAPAAG
ncbi:PAS domain-containing protein [Leisingera sp. S132]|uniref:PAS domain-containing sensor histidine kinase n=1 Tax=Leisingera sp. S132 TaxID=2867016 RepID=UPI0021A32D7A|nr:PAS domain-containing hybrid sensor histidine kinase/response regulator [Leisingera sp. S132]UWQ79959.1 PAS domain-containing protein [Leisingera sp. S132]